MNEIKHIIQLFIDTFTDDHKLSEEETKQLTKVLEEEALKADEIGYLRNRLYDFAEGALTSATPADVFRWMRKVNKLLTRFDKMAALHIPEVYFSPQDDCSLTIRRFIQNSKKTLDICIFTISDDKIAKEIFKAYQNKVTIRLITDDEKVNDLGSDVERFAKTGIKIKTDESKHHMHHKFAISDNLTLLTGSYNWTRAAAIHNFENILLTNQVELVNRYQAEFNRLWAKFRLFDFKDK